MAMGEKILVIIPAYNEEATVHRVAREVRDFVPEADVLVVNDGSTDRTSEEAKKSGVTVLDLPFNLGIGGAMQAGYRYAFEKGYDLAVQVDGDGQHDPREIQKLIDSMRLRGLDLAIGSRFVGNSEYRPSTMRRVGISILSRVISVLVGQKIGDPTSGFRAANRRAIELFAFNYPQDYPEPEVLVLLKRSGLKMGEVAVEMNHRTCGASSITRSRSLYYVAKVLLAIFVDCFKKMPCRSEEEK